MALPLRTARLVIREYTLADLDDVARIFADPLMAESGREPMSRSETQAWLEEEIGHVRRDGTGRYAVAWRESGEVIAGCGLVCRRSDEGDEVELGYHVRPDLWGRGIAREAALACVQEARERGLQRLIAYIEPGNGRSESVARRVGMVPEGPCEWFGRPHTLWALDLSCYHSTSRPRT